MEGSTSLRRSLGLRLTADQEGFSKEPLRRNFRRLVTGEVTIWMSPAADASQGFYVLEAK